MKKEDIQKEKYYTAAQISQMGLLPWNSPYTFNKKLNDPAWQVIFKPMVEQHETNRTYRVKGENIISFLNKLESGEIKL